MTTVPARWDRTIYRGTDHAWQLRRVIKDGETITPIIPTSVEVEVRLNAGADEVWVEPTAAINTETGWITLTIPAAATEGPEWDDRTKGIWAVDVVVNGATLPWVRGRVTVDSGGPQ